MLSARLFRLSHRLLLCSSPTLRILLMIENVYRLNKNSRPCFGDLSKLFLVFCKAFNCLRIKASRFVMVSIGFFP